MIITDYYNRSLHAIVDNNQNVILGVAEEIQEYPDIDLTLTIKNVKKFYYSNHNWVFKIANIPGIIFKIPGNTEEANSSFKDRFNNIEIGNAVCEKLSLTLLHIPDCLKINENILAERKLKFVKTLSDLYKIYSIEKVLEAFKQFVILIGETGLSDTHQNNYKFMADGSGIALFDLEFMNEPPENGLEFLVNGLPDWRLYDTVKGLIKVHNFQAYDKIWPSQALIEVM